MRVYALDSRELMTLARRRITRSLTAGECQRFLRTNPCPSAAAALAHVVIANRHARSGELDSAVQNYARANQHDPDLEIPPDQEAGILGVEALVGKGRALVALHKVPDGIEAFELALKMDPSATRQEVPEIVADAQSFAERGKVLDALQIYQAAARLDTTKVSAVEWNNLCWYGTLWGFAAKVLGPACEKAVELDSANGEIRDSRGVARAVTGDFTGAIEDFQVFVASTPNEDWKAERQGWIDSLTARKNPLKSSRRLRELLAE